MDTTARDNIIGKLATISVGGMWIEIRIMDTKTAYGINRALIEPVRGMGSKWVNMDKLQSIGLPERY